jgi:hypothetical protein
MPPFFSPATAGVNRAPNSPGGGLGSASIVTVSTRLGQDNGDGFVLDPAL